MVSYSMPPCPRALTGLWHKRQAAPHWQRLLPASATAQSASHRAAASRSAAPRRQPLSCSPAFQGRVAPPATAAGQPRPGQRNVSAAALWPPAPQAASPAGAARGRRSLVNVYSRDALRVVNVYLFWECKLFIQNDFSSIEEYLLALANGEL